MLFRSQQRSVRSGQRTSAERQTISRFPAFMNERGPSTDRKVAFSLGADDDDFNDNRLREGLLAAKDPPELRLGDSERTVGSQEIDAEGDAASAGRGTPHVYRGSSEAVMDRT